MTNTTVIYARIYERLLYIGITNNMFRRQKAHNEGKSRTTNRFNKTDRLKEIKFKEINNINYEKSFKQIPKYKKLKMISKWKRWY